MDIFSCLQTRDLPCGGRMDSRNYQYGVEAYSPQFFSRQLGCPQVIPELDYSLINKGSSYRFPKLVRMISWAFGPRFGNRPEFLSWGLTNLIAAAPNPSKSGGIIT
ncbi:hypothetical protein Pyn_02420 [Prunus yedoensis var. nudiflora]|uniref:Uncharacterized protein n=1 Tax=Prunus yedoensis var. nudiflora TaxID=2094558 RepID=A0A314UEN2_PRUYE|nr:hypothetical protein Pyn_02420 [Prunus yedoensis var. nudiflora]